MIFRFESPWILMLLLLLPLVAAWPYLMKQRLRPAALRYADIKLTSNGGKTPRSWRMVMRPLLNLVRLLIVAMIIIALARPQTGQAKEIMTGEGVDIALAVDISGSMASLDFQPQNRLEAAKQVISDFVQERPYDQIGLVVFANSAFNQSPPTVDHNVLLRLLDRVKLATDLKIEDGTAIGMGLANAGSMLKDSQAKSKVVILLTDGVNNAGQIDPVTAAEAAKTLGIKVYTIGMGRPGQVPVPVTDVFGREQVVYQESALDEATLQQIAEVTGGRYFRAEDTNGLKQIYDEINSLEKSQVEIQNYTRYQELAGVVLAPALLLLLGEMALRQTIFRKIP
ncbi:MAG: VWA domain-containing protein [Anaerolineae bacterium]|nr:VWA domain-containing protein [Anaerolineae bacterium]MCB9103595.1 VWA domain-containing protein [Anaerolineales bacterium]